MQRHTRNFLTLTALGAALSISAGNAWAAKGFSSKGGSSLGGSSFSKSIRGSGMSMPAAKSLHSPGIGSFSAGNSRIQSLKVGNLTGNSNSSFSNVVKNLPKSTPRLTAGPATGIHLSGGQSGAGIGNSGLNPNTLLGNKLLGSKLSGNLSHGIAGGLGGNPIGQPGPNQGPGVGGGPGVGQSVGIAKGNCNHVIDLLVRHCVGNHCYDPCVRHRCVDPVWINVGWIPAGPIVQPVLVEQAVGDLELVGVNLVADATPQQGPLYQVSFRNNSPRIVEHFRVSLVAVLGEITETSPTVTVDVPQLAAGETGTIQVQMPVAVMALGPQGQQPVPFDTLVVAIDSFDELVESNELNNVATVKRADVQLLAVQAPAALPGGAAPGNGPAVGPTDGAQPAPSDNAGPMPSDKIDLDKLDLGDANSAATFFK